MNYDEDNSNEESKILIVKNLIIELNTALADLQELDLKVEVDSEKIFTVGKRYSRPMFNLTVYREIMRV